MDEKRFLTSDETAQYLGITIKTLMRLNQQRKMTYYRCDKRCYYDINDIYEYITRVKISAGSKRKLSKTKHEEETNTGATEKSNHREKDN